MKSLTIFFLILLVIVLAYRIFDLGISLTYSDDEIERLQKEMIVISKFQGKDCDEVVGGEQLKDDVFLKDGKIVIEGVEFECKSEGFGRGVLFSHRRK